MANLDKSYSPQAVEDKNYQFWLEKGYFEGQIKEGVPAYSIVMPPPNITGQLHMGHALDNTFQDILIRYKRMQGFGTLWMPGTDHASIATEAKIVAAMKEEGLTKEDIGREKFLERAWDWRRQYGTRIVTQLKKMGSSCDWNRERFTMDEGCSKAVRKVFVDLYKQGLIYQGERIINWCPHCCTSISDAEVEYEEKDGSFWHLRYPFADGSGYVELATTRPETMLGDTAVAVHPEDERYKDMVGKMLILPLVNKEIPLIADDYVDMEFGTGVVKITPAHDPNDYEVGLRHNLPVITVTTEDGYMNEFAGKYEGLSLAACRKAVVEDLEKEGYLVKVEPLKHNVGTCNRCHTAVEPRVSKQWFVKMAPLAAPAIEAVRKGEIKFVPERFSKIYYHWMENIKDWCISRQLWWGHQIPAWYCPDCGEVIVDYEDPSECPHCGCKNLERDPDTLDTWFSSALWPFSTMGWPEQTPELEYFFPTDVLVTGYDIIFFWVARMIFSSIAYTGKIPFHTVFIHGIVRDAQGRKMSKSLGNGIDPLKVIEEHGADALRFTLATGNSPGNDMRFSEEKITASSNFANKIWNAARFINMNCEGKPIDHVLPAEPALEDKWILSKFNTLAKEVSENLDKYELGVAVSKLYDFIWDYLCDWYIELAKIRFNADEKSAKTVREVIIHVMSETMKLLHPFMPFITEEIWQTMSDECESIMISKWPQYSEALHFPEAEAEMNRIIKAIRAIRNRRNEMNVPPSKKANICIATEYTDTFLAAVPFMQRLAGAAEVEVAGSFDMPGAVQVVTDDATIYIPLAELIDFEQERARLEKEKAAVEKKLAQINGKLANEGFLAKAPEKVVEGVKAEKKVMEEKLANINKSIENLG